MPSQEAPSVAATTHRVLIEPGQRMGHYWRELWQYRELFRFLSWRDILVRYKQTTMGVAWAVLRPVLTMAIFTVVFGVLSKLPADGAPYPIVVFAAMLPWQFFAAAIIDGSGSMASNASMLTKIYFPRMIIPASAVIVSLVDFVISLGVLVVLMAWYRHVPGLRLIALPAFTLLAVACSLGFGIWLSALTVKYRDLRHVVPFVVQVGLYVSPVGFSSAVVPERWRLLYSLNPMVGVIDGFRWAILGKGEVYWPGIALSVAVTCVVLCYGIWYFRATERQFADVL